MQPLYQRLGLLGFTGFLLLSSAFIGNKESPNGNPPLVPYDDIGGVTTWCHGETAGTPKARYTVEECDRLLVQSVAKHWDGIKQYVPPEAPASVKAGMVSVAYNVGVSGWAWERDAKGRRVPSRFRVALAAGDWEGACRAITAPWRGKHGVARGYKATVNGRPARGLENRRVQEEAVCLRDLR